MGKVFEGRVKKMEDPEGEDRLMAPVEEVNVYL